jgi:hypothetical protein
MSERLQPAFWGGLFIGVLSALPIVNAGNCCCCLWVLIGGGLAAYLRQQNLPFQIQAAEGALMGLFAGVIGSGIELVLSIPFQMMAGPMQQQMLDRILSQNPDMPPEARAMAERLVASSGLWVFKLFFNLIVFSVFGLLGGLLGVAIFKKNLPPPPPPGTIDVPPTSYSSSGPSTPVPPPSI